MPPTDLLAEFSRKCAAKGRLFEAQIELTHRCNLRCLHCYIHHASLPPESAVENWKATLDQLVDMGLCMVTFTGGEPLLHPGLEELIAHAFGKGCQVRIFSNANLFQDKAHVDRLRTAGLCYLETSIYGANADSHDAITLVPGSFEKTLRAVRWCQEAGIAVTMKTSWMKQNWREYPRVVALAREWGVFFRGSPSLMPRLDGDLANQDHGMSYEELVEFYSMDESNAAPRETGADSSGDTLDAPPCGIARLSMAISPAGDAYPCLHMRVPFANVFRDDIKERWAHAPELQRYRQITLRSFEPCRECDMRRFCFVCMGDGWLEWKDPLRPSTATCLQARARKTAAEARHGHHD